MKFQSKTYGACNTTEVVDNIIDKVKTNKSEYIIAIGTDSQNKGNNTKFCEVIVLYEVGKGGNFFYRTHIENRIDVLQNRMLEEARRSIELAKEVIELLDEEFVNNGFDFTSEDLSLEIHCDLGENGASEVAIRSALGWITAEFGGLVKPRIKPDSPAASHIADMHTK